MIENNIFKILLIALGWIVLFAFSINPDYRSQFATPTGDEPSYFVMMESLIYDLDLDILNNYKETEHEWVPKNQPHMVDIGEGVLLPLHRWGLPLLMSPFYLVGGYLGVYFALSILTFISTILIYVKCCHLYDFKEFEAKFLILILFFTPLFIQSSQLYPETVMFTLISLVIFLSDKLSSTKFKVLFSSIIILLSASLHEKMILLIVPVIFVFIINKNVTLLTLIGLITAPIFYLYLITVYGSNYYDFVMGGAGGQFLSITNIPRSFLLILFDQRSGLIWFFPLLLLSTLFLKVNKNYVILVLLPYIILNLMFEEVHGGFVPPGRYVYPLYPFVLMSILITFHSGSLKIPTYVVLFFSSLIFFGYLIHPGIVYPFWTIPNGYAHYIFGISDSSNILLPEFRTSDPIVSFETLKQMLKSLFPLSLLLMWILYRVNFLHIRYRVVKKNV